MMGGNHQYSDVYYAKIFYLLHFDDKTELGKWDFYSNVFSVIKFSINHNHNLAWSAIFQNERQVDGMMGKRGIMQDVICDSN